MEAQERAFILRVGLILLMTAVTGRTQGDRGWRISGGVIYRHIDDISLRTTSLSSGDTIPDIGRTLRGDVTSEAGPDDAVADRKYRDGYVRQDPGTQRDGDTWFWGYRDSGQVQGETLVFHGEARRQTILDRETLVIPGNTIDEGDEGVGPYLEVLKRLKANDAASLHVLLAVYWVPFSVRGRSTALEVSQSVTAYEERLVDSYDLAGVIPPPTPYAGDFTGPGPLLPNIPEKREIERRKISRTTSRHYYEVSEELDVHLTTMSLGLQGEWDTGLIHLAAAAGPTLNYVRTEGKHVELLTGQSGGVQTTVEQYTDRFGDDNLRLGAFAQAGVTLYLNGRSRAEFHGRYDLVDSVSGELGPSDYRVDLDGFSMLVAFSLDL